MGVVSIREVEEEEGVVGEVVAVDGAGVIILPARMGVVACKVAWTGNRTARAVGLEAVALLSSSPDQVSAVGRFLFSVQTWLTHFLFQL